MHWQLNGRLCRCVMLQSFILCCIFSLLDANRVASKIEMRDAAQLCLHFLLYVPLIYYITIYLSIKKRLVEYVIEHWRRVKHHMQP